MKWSVDPGDPLGVSLADIGLEGAPSADRAPAEPADFEPPQVVDGLPFAEYNADLGSVSASGLRLLASSPLHHWHALRRPDREPEVPTDAQVFGTAIHCAVLEPDAFESRFAARPPMDRRTKEGKAAYAEFMESIGDRSELKSDQWHGALAVAASVRETEMGRMLLAGGRSEVSVYWTDRATGIRCRMRPDFVPSSQPVLVDLKSCENASDTAFGPQAWRLGYHVTAAFYVDGWRAATGEKRDYVFAAWEKEPPYASAWYYADDQLLEAGRCEYERLLRIYARCLEADEWPGYPAMLQPLFPPAWAMDRER